MMDPSSPAAAAARAVRLRAAAVERAFPKGTDREWCDDGVEAVRRLLDEPSEIANRFLGQLNCHEEQDVAFARAVLSFNIGKSTRSEKVMQRAAKLWMDYGRRWVREKVRATDDEATTTFGGGTTTFGGGGGGVREERDAASDSVWTSLSRDLVRSASVVSWDKVEHCQSEVAHVIRHLAAVALPRFLASLASADEVCDETASTALRRLLRDLWGRLPQSAEAWLGLLASFVNEAPVCCVVADVATPGAPIVYVNAQFTKATGYEEHEVLGGNLGVLQGPQTECQAVERIRRGMRHAWRVHTLLTNYRKNGEVFRNLLTLTPVFDANKYYRFVIGAQFEIEVARRAATASLSGQQNIVQRFVRLARFASDIPTCLTVPSSDDALRLMLRGSLRLDDPSWVGGRSSDSAAGSDASTTADATEKKKMGRRMSCVVPNTNKNDDSSSDESEEFDEVFAERRAQTLVPDYDGPEDVVTTRGNVWITRCAWLVHWCAPERSATLAAPGLAAFAERERAGAVRTLSALARAIDLTNEEETRVAAKRHEQMRAKRGAAAGVLGALFGGNLQHNNKKDAAAAPERGGKASETSDSSSDQDPAFADRLADIQDAGALSTLVIMCPQLDEHRASIFVFEDDDDVALSPVAKPATPRARSKLPPPPQLRLRSLKAATMFGASLRGEATGARTESLRGFSDATSSPRASRRLVSAKGSPTKGSPVMPRRNSQASTDSRSSNVLSRRRESEDRRRGSATFSTDSPPPRHRSSLPSSSPSSSKMSFSPRRRDSSRRVSVASRRESVASRRESVASRRESTHSARRPSRQQQPKEDEEDEAADNEFSSYGFQTVRCEVRRLSNVIMKPNTTREEKVQEEMKEVREKCASALIELVAAPATQKNARKLVEEVRSAETRLNGAYPSWTMRTALCGTMIDGDNSSRGDGGDTAWASQFLPALGDALSAHGKVGLVGVDARAPGCPLIYVNDGFAKLVKRQRREVVGRNCNLLQTNPKNEKVGPATADAAQRAAIARLAKCVRKNREGVVRVRNYDGFGEAFWCVVVIAPVWVAGRDECAYLVGAQLRLESPAKVAAELFAADVLLRNMPRTTTGSDLEASEALRHARDLRHRPPGCLHDPTIPTHLATWLALDDPAKTTSRWTALFEALLSHDQQLLESVCDDLGSMLARKLLRFVVEANQLRGCDSATAKRRVVRELLLRPDNALALLTPLDPEADADVAWRLISEWRDHLAPALARIILPVVLPTVYRRLVRPRFHNAERSLRGTAERLLFWKTTKLFSTNVWGLSLEAADFPIALARFRGGKRLKLCAHNARAKHLAATCKSPLAALLPGCVVEAVRDSASLWTVVRLPQGSVVTCVVQPLAEARGWSAVLVCGLDARTRDDDIKTAIRLMAVWSRGTSVEADSDEDAPPGATSSVSQDQQDYDDDDDDDEEEEEPPPLEEATDEDDERDEEEEDPRKASTSEPQQQPEVKPPSPHLVPPPWVKTPTIACVDATYKITCARLKAAAAAASCIQQRPEPPRRSDRRLHRLIHRLERTYREELRY
ncbi:hypothetical protein CTAYLR_005970 [Chrysophaeum taylorii]|uniref:PAS domain-containing protein n=1 Tax=Chrysophaeum taylorii TaxID=2483200 RepID=A0AAD7UKR9_9STRA|nr:hypothetical protein CTAYLR_005970 [Chrysophaeum taylorii]